MRVTHVITRLIVGGAQENTIASVFGLRARPGVEVDLISGPTTGPEGSLASLIAFGLLAYVLVLMLPRVWMRVAVVVLLCLLVLSIGFSRAYLGAHYLTDVLGGFAVGGCWLAVCISGLETIRRRRKWLAEEKVSQPELARQEG